LVYVLASCARKRKIVATRGKRRLRPQSEIDSKLVSPYWGEDHFDDSNRGPRLGDGGVGAGAFGDTGHRSYRRLSYRRLRDGTCDGEPARFYTRALMRFPKAYGIAAMTLKLKTGCD